MPKREQNFLACILTTVRQTKEVVSDLLEGGTDSKAISLLMSEKIFQSDPNIARGLSYFRYLEIPLLGNFVAAGPFASSFANWAVKGFAEPIIDLFLDLGISEFDARQYLLSFAKNGSFCYIDIEEASKYARTLECLRKFGALEISSSHLNLNEEYVSNAKPRNARMDKNETYRPIL